MPKTAAYVQMTTAGPEQQHTHMHLQNSHSSNAMKQIYTIQSHPTHAATLTGRETLYLSSSLVAAKASWYRDRVETLGLEPWRCRFMYASWYTCIRACAYAHAKVVKVHSHTATYSVKAHHGGTSGSPFSHGWAFQQLTELSLCGSDTRTHTAPPVCVSQQAWFHMIRLQFHISHTRGKKPPKN